MTNSTETDARQLEIIEAAAGIFFRYGFRKTSMDDVARAVGISRQGLYLHFPNKEALFKATVVHLAGTMRSTARQALSRPDIDVESRLLSAFESAFSKVAGSENLDELLATAVALVGPVIRELEETMTSDVAHVLRDTGVAARWKDSGISAKDLAGHLLAASDGIKRKVKTPGEYRDRMRIAVRLVCGSLPKGSRDRS